MDLYRTAKGEWHGTQAAVTKANRLEGSKAGAWKKVTVPDRKASRIDFLNAMRREAAAEARPEPARTRTPPKPRKGARWRVWGGLETRFIGTVRADSGEDAIAEIAETMKAAPDPHHD